MFDSMTLMAAEYKEEENEYEGIMVYVALRRFLKNEKFARASLCTRSGIESGNQKR